MSVLLVAPTRSPAHAGSLRRAVVRSPRTRERGATSLTFALLLIPLLLVVGCAIDFARFVEYRSALQSAADEAALAGAAVFSDPSHGPAAVGVATEYFRNALLPPSLSVSAPKVTANANGTINPALGTAPAHTVTVAATATVATTLMSLVMPSAALHVTATAGNPIVTPQLAFTNVNSIACDGNTAYLYEVPPNDSGVGYDFSKVPSFSVASNGVQGNYYEIGTSYLPGTANGQLPAGQQLPSFGVNQPLGIMMRNDTNGNLSGCGAPVTGANSYGAPNGGSQAFYSSLLLNKQPPSQFSNYHYQVTVTSVIWSDRTEIASVTTTLPPSILYPNGATISEPIEGDAKYNTLATYLGINDPSSGYSNCTAITSTDSSESHASARSRTFAVAHSVRLPTTTTTYQCETQYPTNTTSSTPNCLLYVQTGVSPQYIAGLSDSSPVPQEARGNCFPVQGGGTQYAAPSCAQLSALAVTSGNSPVSPAAVFWWDDGGGVGPNEHYYLPQGHCSASSVNGPGYGEDCLYKNNFFAAICTVNGGSGSGLTEVILTQ
ncbi:pilus assembly protein TadG-related protein [Trinickia fusca]|uniref:Putative Flp pilus-assembly TadG-like N-terminal domain-containing protein n=1 Tax=Trinickia fusca TaxID=2419777 RepID=A0A494XIX0_9BURK|nr:pilus assembly protein TadG-related protein [Trinickia fusca]RKP50620.1 hypothetical protein D7S89_05830 [Trinickia fusca]